MMDIFLNGIMIVIMSIVAVGISSFLVSFISNLWESENILKRIFATILSILLFCGICLFIGGMQTII